MNLAKSLILHKRINTTVAKAKALRKEVEPILTKAKKDTMHARREVFSFFQDKEPVKELFGNIAEKIAHRPGGYTRIIKLGNRLGDNAEMCMMELVDYNELLQKETKSISGKSTRRSRRKSSAAGEKQESTSDLLNTAEQSGASDEVTDTSAAANSAELGPESTAAATASTGTTAAQATISTDADSQDAPIADSEKPVEDQNPEA